MRGPLILGAVMALPAAALAAGGPTALGQIAGGLWEVSGAPGSQTPIRQCLANVQMLAQFEHRARNCTRTVLNNNGASTVISYRCGPSDFGQSQIDVITPRSLRIATQGISDQLPFNYVIQARRVGDCDNSASTPRH